MLAKDFSPAEESIIKNMMLSKSHKDIAALLRCGKEDVKGLIVVLTKDTNIVTHQMKLDQRAAGRPHPVKVKIPRPPTKAATEKEKKLKEKVSLRAQQQKNTRERKSRNRPREPEFKTKDVDYSKMIIVKVDRKTFIQVPAGSDIEAVKNKYLERSQNSKTEATHYKEVKNVNRNE